jgi:peptidoglycan/xylan/chitin deacetylase (PgdA/CDA1 family)
MQAKSKSALSGKSAPRKQRRPNNFYSSGKTLIILLELIAVIVGIYFILKPSFNNITPPKSGDSKFSDILKKKFPTSSPVPIPTITPSPSPSPTPKPLTFEEMNNLYGPCVRASVLMYHHVQTKDAAAVSGQSSLTVYTDIFRSQMEYLKSRGYNVISVNDLVEYFDTGRILPGKNIILTFDDGYRDFYTDAYPVLSEMRFTAAVYLSTGLMNNPGYLSWDEVGAMKGSILFGNHTWSHKTVLTNNQVMETEIKTADYQLEERSLNSPKTFAYPYGPESVPAKNYISSLGYRAAFTTRNGNILCKQKRLELPRIRVGNVSLSYYGF